MGLSLLGLPRPVGWVDSSELSVSIARKEMSASNNWILSTTPVPDNLLTGNDDVDVSTPTTTTDIPYITPTDTVTARSFEVLYKNLQGLNHTTVNTNDNYFVRTYTTGSGVIIITVDLTAPNLAISKIRGDIGTTLTLVRKVVFDNDTPISTIYYTE